MSRRYLFGGGLGLGLLLLLSPCLARAQAQFLGKPLATWANDLGSNDPVTRRSAAFALGKIGKEAVPMLPQLLKALREDKVASVRETAALALGEIGKTDTRAAEEATMVQVLMEALGKDSDAQVRRGAAVALGGLGERAKSAIPSLERALGDPSGVVRQNAAWALGRVGTKDVSALKKVLADADPLVLRDAAGSLGLLGANARAALPELLARCATPDTEARKAVLGALVGLVQPGDKPALAPLQLALADSDVEVRRNAALALGNIGGAEARDAVPILVEALEHGEVSVRRQAAAVVRNIGPAAKAALEPLRKALKDSDPVLRRNAAVGLGGLRKEAASAAPDLMRVLTNGTEDAQARIEAAVALSRLGPVAPARDTMPALVNILKDVSTDPKVRERTLWVVGVHQKELEQYKEFPALFETLTRIIKEPRTDKNRMLRYTAATILVWFERANAPKEALDPLLEFLKDNTLKLYDTTKGASTSIRENDKGSSETQEQGKGDGRAMAVKALRRVGYAKLASRPDIIKQLRTLRDDPRTDENLREEIKKAFDDFGQ
jgi:HEAT repeat protein